MVNFFLILILIIIVGDYLLDIVVETLNVKNLSTDLPEEFVGYYDAQKYKQSQEYLKETTRFGIFIDSISTPLTIIFILIGGFNLVDTIARSLNQNMIITGLIFAAILMLLSQLLSIPFSIYSTFVIEEKYGFNRTTPKTFILDFLKGWALTLILGGIVFSIILWFFDKAGSMAWIYCWVTVVIFQIVVTFFAPIIILPLFNKFHPLEDGDLKAAIEEYAKSQNFKLKGIFKMDASRRSTKSNAFFTGFGKYRRIVLFDTLIEKHTVDELLSILAHEMGHYKKKHIVKSILLSIATTGIMFYILSLFLNNESLFAAFQMENISIYASLFFFGFLYTPISMIISIGGKILSRKHEFEADTYASQTYKKPAAMISALKKLTVDNLSNLTPHPLKVFLSYSHPPVLERIRTLQKST
jgi:STE24 endopeptidase